MATYICLLEQKVEENQLKLKHKCLLNIYECNAKKKATKYGPVTSRQRGYFGPSSTQLHAPQERFRSRTFCTPHCVDLVTT